jgi:hypothetical protein
LSVILFDHKDASTIIYNTDWCRICISIEKREFTADFET